jgi:hypothetical protein
MFRPLPHSTLIKWACFRFLCYWTYVRKRDTLCLRFSVTASSVRFIFRRQRIWLWFSIPEEQAPPLGAVESFHLRVVFHLSSLIVFMTSTGSSDIKGWRPGFHCLQGQVQTGTEVPDGYEGICPRGQIRGAWSWPLISILYRASERVKLYPLHHALLWLGS